MAVITFGTTAGTGFPAHPALSGGGALAAFAQAVADAVSHIGKPNFLVDGTTVCKTVTVTWDNATNVVSATVS